MGEPPHALPVLQGGIVLLVVYEDELDVRIAVRGRDPCHDRMHHLQGAALSRAAHDADEPVLHQVHADRHLMEHAVLIPDHLRLLDKRIVDQGKLFLRNGDLRLERAVPEAKPCIQKVCMGKVPVPQPRLPAPVLDALPRGRIDRVHGRSIVSVLLLHPVRDLHQIIAVGIKALFLVLRQLLFRIIHVQDGPDRADDGGADGRHEACVHEHAGIASRELGRDDAHHAAQRHGDRHGESRSDHHIGRALLLCFRRGRALDLDGFRIQNRKVPGGTVEPVPVPRLPVCCGLLRRRVRRVDPQRRKARLIHLKASAVAPDKEQRIQEDQVQAEDVDLVPVVELPVSPHALVSDEDAVFAVVKDVPAVPAVPQDRVDGTDQPHIGIADSIVPACADGDVPRPGDVIFFHDMEGDGHVRRHHHQHLPAPRPDLQDLFIFQEQIPGLTPPVINHVAAARVKRPAGRRSFQLQRDILLQTVHAFMEADAVIRVIYIGKKDLSADLLVIDHQNHGNSPGLSNCTQMWKEKARGGPETEDPGKPRVDGAMIAGFERGGRRYGLRLRYKPYRSRTRGAGSPPSRAGSCLRQRRTAAPGPVRS